MLSMFLIWVSYLHFKLQLVLEPRSTPTGHLVRQSSICTTPQPETESVQY
jgi:hypothetical protein